MSSLRSTSVTVMRPPKPPSWRDFVTPTNKNIISDSVDVPDPIVRAQGSKSPISEISETARCSFSIQGSKPARLARRPRARIHRTRSEHVIDSHDLPESVMTATLAEAEPKGVRNRRSVEYDGRLYVEENNRRCQSWLASIKSCEPLDEVDYVSDNSASESSRVSPELNVTKNDVIINNINKRYSETSPNRIPIHDLREAVDVEIPEETFVWHEETFAPEQYGRSPSFPPSSSSGEDICCSCTKSSYNRGEKKTTTSSTINTTITSGINLVLNNVVDLHKTDEGTVKKSKSNNSHLNDDFTLSKKDSTYVSRRDRYQRTYSFGNYSNLNTSGYQNKQNISSLLHTSNQQELNHVVETGRGIARRTSSQSVLCDMDLYPLDPV